MHSAPSSPNPAPAQRLDGLDLARYLAFVGMVIVNFKIVMGAENEQGLLASLTAMLEGRAAATFVVLAGIGLGLAARRAASPTIATTLKRALFLLVIGLLNMTVFEADILHYYAFYFVFGAVLLPLSTRWLIGAILGLNALFLAMVVLLNYDAGWEWESYSYSGFWTPAGFVRNLFFNGWHPVVPWLGFLLFGVGPCHHQPNPARAPVFSGRDRSGLRSDGGLPDGTEHSPPHGRPAALVFCAAATVYASLWTKAFGRGPVEALMRKTAG